MKCPQIRTIEVFSWSILCYCKSYLTSNLRWTLVSNVIKREQIFKNTSQFVQTFLFTKTENLQYEAPILFMQKKDFLKCFAAKISTPMLFPTWKLLSIREVMAAFIFFQYHLPFPKYLIFKFQAYDVTNMTDEFCIMKFAVFYQWLAGTKWDLLRRLTQDIFARN